MKCNICDKLMVSVYVTDPLSNSKTKKAIGKICLRHGIEHASTPYFQELKYKLAKIDETEKETKGHHKRPEFHGIAVPICSKCGGKTFDKHTNKKPEWASYENSDGSKNWQLNNPYVKFTCKKCKQTITAGLPMPHPLPKKYKKQPN